MTYAFAVENRANAREKFKTVFVRTFACGYVGSMLADAKGTATFMRGKLATSVNGVTVETLEVPTLRAFAEAFEVSLADVKDQTGGRA